MRPERGRSGGRRLRRGPRAAVAGLLMVAAGAALAGPVAAVPVQEVGPGADDPLAHLDTLAGPGITVLHAPGEEGRARRALESLLDQPPLPALPTGVPTGVRAVLAPDEATFAAAAGGAVPEWGAGVAVPSRMTLVMPAYASPRSGVGSGPATLRHEWAHLGLHQYLEGLRVPRWFDEGYAQWASGGWDAMEAWRLRLLLATGRAPPLDSLTLDWPRDRASAEAAYLLAASAVEYLLSSAGERGLRIFLERWREGGSFEAALRRTYGVTSGQFEEDWQEFVKDRYGWLLVLSHSAAFWSFLGLLLILMMVIRRRRNREQMARLRAREPPERPAWWEGPGGE